MSHNEDINTNVNIANDTTSTINTEITSRVHTNIEGSTERFWIFIVCLSLFYLFAYKVWSSDYFAKSNTQKSIIIVLSFSCILFVFTLYDYLTILRHRKINSLPLNQQTYDAFTTAFSNNISSWIFFYIIILCHWAFPGWLIPFANTFGEKFQNWVCPGILKKMIINDKVAIDDPFQKHLIRKLNNQDYQNLLLNTLGSRVINEDNLNESLTKELKSMEIFNVDNEDHINALSNCIKRKYFISRGIWYISVSTLCLMMNTSMINYSLFTT